MAILPLTTGVENKILRTISKPVKKIDRTVKKLIANMIETMFDCDGLGIAAPQVGVNLRIYIARLNFNTDNEMIVPMINAKLISLSQEKEKHEEGCLSIPGEFGVIERHSSVTVRYMDEQGKSHVLTLRDLNARIMQHETDHLNGILIADKMTDAVVRQKLFKKST